MVFRLVGIVGPVLVLVAGAKRIPTASWTAAASRLAAAFSQSRLSPANVFIHSDHSTKIISPSLRARTRLPNMLAATIRWSVWQSLPRLLF